jgi:thiazole synthase ThiGH ThiG subunit
VRMAAAFAKAVEAGHTAFEIGLPEAMSEAVPTSPLAAYFAHST